MLPPRDDTRPVPVLDPGEVTAVLCDADGNLFPSEEPAFEASVTVTNRLLHDLGSPRRYTASRLRQLALGRNFRSLAIDFAGEQGAELTPGRLERWVAEEASVVTAHLSRVLVPDGPTRAALESLARHLRLAVVSSSALTRLAACFTAADLDDLLPPQVRYSAQDSLAVPTSKPDPAVYRHALADLGLRPGQAVAVEDAASGVASAVAAGIPTVGNLVHVAPHERETRAQELRAAGAAHVVTSWAAVVDLLVLEQEQVS